MTDLLTRTLALDRHAAHGDKLRKLERFVGQSPLARAETVPLFAALLALPLPAECYPSLTLISPTDTPAPVSRTSVK